MHYVVDENKQQFFILMILAEFFLNLKWVRCNTRLNEFIFDCTMRAVLNEAKAIAKPKLSLT